MMNSNKDLLQRSFPGTLKSVLDEHGISNRKLANLSGLDPGHVSRLVNGRRSPQSETVQKLTRALARLGLSDRDIDLVQYSAGFAVSQNPELGKREAIGTVTTGLTTPTDPTPITSATEDLPESSVDPPTITKGIPLTDGLWNPKLNMGSSDTRAKFFAGLISTPNPLLAARRRDPHDLPPS